MGIFDSLIDQHEVEWQTKSFAVPNMDRYRITGEGQLEKGEPLSLPRRYTENTQEISAMYKQLFARPPKWAWTKHQFSGRIRASVLRQDKVQWATFDFKDGMLFRYHLV